MVKTALDPESDNMAQKRLIEVKGIRTWKVVAKELKFNQGYLNRVARGKRPASDRLRLALGLHPLHVTVAPLPCGCPPVGKRCPVHQPKSTRQPDPVVRVKRVDAARIAALKALYSSRGIGNEQYRIGLNRTINAMTD